MKLPGTPGTIFIKIRPTLTTAPAHAITSARAGSPVIDAVLVARTRRMYAAQADSQPKPTVSDPTSVIGTRIASPIIAPPMLMAAMAVPWLRLIDAALGIHDLVRLRRARPSDEGEVESRQLMQPPGLQGLESRLAGVVVAALKETFDRDSKRLELERQRIDMRDSVVWYFQETAKRLGPDRERQYLARFTYGNQDSSSGLTSFWLGGSLAISPDEQLRFFERLYDGSLPVSRKAIESVREILRQPAGSVVNAAGAHPFGGRWPEGTVLSAKTGAGSTAGGAIVRWLVGHVSRGSRSWIFVSNVVGGSDTPALAAIEQAERALQEARVLR